MERRTTERAPSQQAKPRGEAETEPSDSEGENRGQTCTIHTGFERRRPAGL